MAWRGGRLAGALVAVLACAGCGEAAGLAPGTGGVSAGTPALPPGDGAAVLVRPSRAAAAKGTQITFEVEHRNLPPGAGLVLALVRDVPADEAHLYQGATGPLTLRPQPVAGDQRTVFEWNGRDVACAPADAPTWCPADVGRYRVHARVFDRSDFALVGWPDRTPRTLLAESVSAPFVLTGAPDLEPLERQLRSSAVQHVAERLFLQQGAPLAATEPITRALTPSGAPRRSGDGFCVDYDAAAPFRGRLRACAGPQVLTEAGLRVRPADISTSGEVGWAQGVLPFQQARAAALAAADAAYLSRVRFREQPTPVQAGMPPGADFQAWSRANPLATTYLDSGVMDWAYRTDANAWAFLVSEVMAGGQDDAPGRFADKVLVRVDGAGRACIAAAAPYKGSPGLEVTTAPLTCR